MPTSGAAQNIELFSKDECHFIECDQPTDQNDQKCEEIDRKTSAGRNARSNIPDRDRGDRENGNATRKGRQPEQSRDQPIADCLSSQHHLSHQRERNRDHDGFEKQDLDNPIVRDRIRTNDRNDARQGRRRKKRNGEQLTKGESRLAPRLHHSCPEISRSPRDRKLTKIGVMSFARHLGCQAARKT